uniref:Tudor domain-containing protein n=1 Tax=Macrostomum lignano TaxID=282301 RepID=A0A1I8F8R6_9PLAT
PKNELVQSALSQAKRRPLHYKPRLTCAPRQCVNGIVQQLLLSSRRMGKLKLAPQQPPQQASVESISHRLVARPDLRSLSQVAGPAFVPGSSFPFTVADPLSDWCSGVQLVGLGRRGIIACELLERQRLLKVPASAIIPGPPTPHWQPKAAAFTRAARQHLGGPSVYAMRLVAWDPPGFELEFHVLHETPGFLLELVADVGTRVKIVGLLRQDSPTKARPVQRRQAQLASRRCHLELGYHRRPSNKKQRRKKSRAAVELNETATESLK